MPAQDLIDQIDKGLEGLNVAETPILPVLPARGPAVQAPTLRDDEADLLSWAENFSATKPKDIATPSGDARADKERAVRAFKADVPAASGSTFGRNVSKGFLNIGETSLGFFESITDILGASKAKSYLKEKGDRLAELNRAIPNEIESVTDIEDAGDAGAFAAMAVGQLAPQIATSLLSGGAGLAAAAGRGAGAKIAATIAGTVVPSVIQESGGIYRGVRDETGVEAPVTSLTFGAIAGALEAVTPSRFLLKVFDTGTDELKRKAVSSLLKQTAREVLKSSGTEFATEVAQEAIALGANKFADGTYDLINSKNAVRLIDAGLMGLVGGAALGSVEPSIERAIKYTRQQEDQNANEARTQQTDVEKERETALAQARATGVVGDSVSGQIIPAEPRPRFAPPPFRAPEPAQPAPTQRPLAPTEPRPRFAPPPVPVQVPPGGRRPVEPPPFFRPPPIVPTRVASPALPADADSRAIERIADAINAGPLTRDSVNKIISETHGGTLASGVMDAKNLTDLVEAAVNRIILSNAPLPNHTPEEALQTIANLKALLSNVPTQTTRTEEQVKFQQFSTPPPLAYVANWVANITPADVVLESSAGIGGLAVFAKAHGAKVLANELSGRRAKILGLLGIADSITELNAELIHALFEPKIQSGEIQRPTVVVMNPPFSSAATTDRKNTLVGAKHVEQALNLLPVGGRLVAIVGEGMALDRPTFKPWWRKIGNEYSIRANIGVSGKEYAKYGTTFGNQLLVIDKTGPTLAPIATGNVETVEELVPLLERIRNDRPRTEQKPNQPSGATPVAPVGSSPRPTIPTPVDSGSGGVVPPERRTDGAERPVGGVNPVPSGSGETPGRGIGPDAGGGITPPVEPVSGEGGVRPSPEPTERVTLETQGGEKQVKLVGTDGVFAVYEPTKVKIPGSKPHPTELVESASMASVLPVDPTYTPSLPSALIKSGAVSEAQIEQVVYAGQAFEKMLPSGERQGYFIGDGTGVGKGRIIAAIIADNWRNGRRRAVWVSKGKNLINDAKRDVTALGLKPDSVIDLAKKITPIPSDKDGIAFLTYKGISTNNPGVKDGVLQPSSKANRMQTLMDWLGADYDGVIALDEVHLAGNAVAVKGTFGTKEPSQRALAIVDLQRLFPKARILYVSATGATDVTNLSYGDRLGIWGPGKPFPTKHDFFNKIQAGGLSAMEIVARDLKAMGVYLARTLSFRGVDQIPVVHPLTSEQRSLYNELSDAWQFVFANVDMALAGSGQNNNGQARGRAMGTFWGAEQRFFNQLLTALQMPTVLREIKADLADKKQIVVQLVNTNEATLNRELAEQDEDDPNLEELDLSPKDILLGYIDKKFPTQLYQPVTDEDGNESWKPVFESYVDPQGVTRTRPVQDPKAVALKKETLGRLSLLKAPQNPMEQLLDTFGVDMVAEVTGRSKRVVWGRDDQGKRARVVESRNEAMRKTETDQFNAGKRRILIFSDAGGTGFSYHSGSTFKNQEQRNHYLVQAGWRADGALQGMGRTHRADQVVPPFYKLVSTDLKGHQRFISTIARRLNQLGALTSGERKTAGAGVFTEEQNLEGPYSNPAIHSLFMDAWNGELEGFDFRELARKLGFVRTRINERSGEVETEITLIDSKTGALNSGQIPNVPRFLNRILALNVDEQNRLFDAFFQRLQTKIELAKQQGKYDPGTQERKALAIRVIKDEVAFTHESGAVTRLVDVEIDEPIKKLDWEGVSKLNIERWIQVKQNKRIYGLAEGHNVTDEHTGNVTKVWRRIGVRGHSYTSLENTDGFEEVAKDEAKTLWNSEYDKTPKSQTLNETYVVGAFLPIWDRIGLLNPRIFRLKTNKGAFLGALVPESMVPGVRSRLGAGAGEALGAQTVFRGLMAGDRYNLANGWVLRRSKVLNEWRIEAVGLEWSNRKEWTDFFGGYTEQIQWTERFFIPNDEQQAVTALEKILTKAPVVPDDPRGAIGQSTPTPPIPPVPSTGVAVVTFDIPAFKQRVAASNLSPEAKSFINAFLNSKAAKYLEGARFRIAEALDGGWEGSYFKGLVEIAETATPGVAPQEFMHRIFDLLPEADKQSIEALRQERLAELQAQYPNDPLLATITAAPMTTASFVAANPTDQQITDLYPVTTTDEFFAHMMSDKFVARTKGATSRGLISTIREAIKDLVAAIKKGFRLPVTADEMFRNVINGRYDVTPEGGAQSEARRGAVVPITRVKTIERVAAFAKPGAERQTEALLATGQVTSVRNILGSFLKTVPSLIQDRVGRLVGFERMDAISTYVRDVLGQSLTEYAAARAKLTDEGLKNLLAVHTNRAFELFEQNAAKLKALLARQQKKLTSPAWASKLRDLARKRFKADATTAAREAMQLALKNGLDRAVKRIQESGGNDATFESAEQERQFYEQLLSRSGEVATAMDSIAKALGFTPDGVSIVFGKKGNNANDILTFYHMMVPLPPADPVTGRNPQFAINRVAAEILARNVTLRQQMVAALWAENAALARPIATFEDKVVHDMQAGNPKTVIGKLIRRAGDLSNTEGKAAAAFMAKYRELLREVEKLEALEEAVRVVDATLVDKQYRAVRVQVATDAKAEIRPQDAKALETGEPFYSTSHIYLPDGTIVELNMFPDKARFQDELTKKLDPALTAINKWLFDATNLDHPARAFYQQQYDTFKALWWSSTAVNPPKQLVIFRNTVFKMLDSMLEMLDPMLGSIGTRSTTLAQTAGQVWKDANHNMGDWLAKWNPLIVDSMARAAKSHPAIWEGQSRGAATDEWHSSVFVPLAASVQDPARPGYKVGDVIYESGEVVTQQDMDALELQVAATGASFKIDLTVGRKGLALPNVVEDRFVPGLKFLRRPIAFAKNMMMRRFDSGGRDIGIAFAALKEKISAQPPANQRAALENFWNDHFQYIKSAVVNRNAQYSNLTEFEDVLAAARPEIANGSISNVAELVDFVFGRTLEDPEVITDWLFGELDRHATAIHKATATKADLGLLEIAMVEDQNPFTVGRGGEIAPPAWYSYGFNDSRSIYNFSMSGSSFYFEILIKSLNAVSADLGAEISRQGTAIDALATKLGKGKEAQARQIVNRQNQEDIRMGRQTFDLETAADMKRGLDKLILNLNQRFSPGGRRLEEEFGIANKVWGDFISGVLFSSYTLARNALEGGFIQNGFRMSRLFGSTLQGFPRAFLGLMQTFLKVGGAGLWSLPVAAFKLRPIAGARALLTTGNVLKAEQTFFGDAIRELATNMFERVQMFRDLEAAGLGMPAYPAETVQASAQYPLTFGQIVKESPMAETPFGRLLQNIGPGLLTFYDAQISLFLRPFFPRVGDQIANLAVANATLGGIHNLEARLRKLFSVYRAAGVPVASLSTHVFTPSEILGKWFGIERTQTSLREIQQWFHKSLIPFNDSVFDYLTRLEQDPKAAWLTHEEKMRLITTNAEAVNVATPLNRPELFKRNLPMRMVGGLLGWNVSALRNAVNNFTAVAASDPNFSRNQLRLATYTMFLATLAYSALGQAGIEEILRFLSWMLNNEERATRQPWEQEGADQAKQWAVYAFNSIPFVATAVNTAFSDLPNKAGFSPTLLAQQKVIDVLNYVSGAIRTRDITYRLPQLVRGFIPFAPVVLNRLPATEGTIEALNASRLYRRYGDLDLIRRSTGGPGAGATATRLTPYGDRILNALAQGDYESAEALKAEAVNVATQLGKPDPERSVEQSIVSRLPHRRAFKETPNAAQMARVMAKMSSSERAQVTQLNDTLKVGLDRMGIKTDFVDQPRLTDAPRSRLAGGGLRLDRPRRGRRSRLIGLSNRRSRTSSRLRSRTRRRRRLSAFA